MDGRAKRREIEGDICIRRATSASHEKPEVQTSVVVSEGEKTNKRERNQLRSTIGVSLFSLARGSDHWILFFWAFDVGQNLLLTRTATTFFSW